VRAIRVRVRVRVRDWVGALRFNVFLAVVVFKGTTPPPDLVLTCA